MTYEGTVSLKEEQAIIGSDSYDQVHAAWRSINDKRRAIPEDELELRVRADTLAGSLNERLSMIIFEEDGDLGREHHAKARSHYYWAANWQEQIVHEHPMSPNTQYYRGLTLFNWGRTKILEGLLEPLPHREFPKVYQYLEKDRRNHEGITRYLLLVPDSPDLPTLSGPVIADGTEGVGILRDMDRAHERALRGLSKPYLIEQVIERTQRADRLRESFIRLIRFLDDRESTHAQPSISRH